MSGRRALIIDTAGPVIGVAGVVGDRSVCSVEERIVLGADGWLLPAMSDALVSLGGLRAGDCIVVGVGPGAFTGIRVGLSAALGLAESIGCGIVPVSSLALRAAANPGHARLVVALDARKGRVYVAEFDTTGARPSLLGEERDIAPEHAFTGDGVATGEGACVYRDRLGLLILVAQPDTCGAAAAGCFVQDDALDPADVHLAYLRGEDQVVTVARKR